MAKTQDFTAAFKDIMGAFPIDTKAMEQSFKSQATLAEKMSAVNIHRAFCKMGKRHIHKAVHSDNCKS